MPLDEQSQAASAAMNSDIRCRVTRIGRAHVSPALPTPPPSLAATSAQQLGTTRIALGMTPVSITTFVTSVRRSAGHVGPCGRPHPQPRARPDHSKHSLGRRRRHWLRQQLPLVPLTPQLSHALVLLALPDPALRAVRLWRRQSQFVLPAVWRGSAPPILSPPDGPQAEQLWLSQQHCAGWRNHCPQASSWFGPQTNLAVISARHLEHNERGLNRAILAG